MEKTNTLLNIRQAVLFSKNAITERGLRKACARGYVPGAQRIGRDWIISLEAIKHYLNHRPRRGRKKTRKQ